MKKYLLFPLILCGNFAFSQLNESFNDGNLTSNPVWTGSNSGNDFNIVTEQLRSNSTTASSNLYLSTVNNLAANCQWEFWVNLQFNTSSANYVDVYLISDQQNLQSSNINGYFIRIGNTNDEICLYKRSGTTTSSTKLIDGVDGILNTSNNKVKIRVTRTANTFTLERDITGLGTSFVTEGNFQDGTFTTSGYFGIFIQQSTSSFFQKHFFDDFKINALNTDTSPPKLLSATVVDSTGLEILFDEPVDSVTAKSVSNYSINNNYGNPISVKTTADASKYVLTLSKGLNTASYLLIASNIKDKAGNLISSDNTATFSFIKPFQAIKGDIVINEIFADPSPQIDLPSVEFIELFNTTNQTISLKNWKYSDPVSTATLPADSIKSNEYLIFCAKADTTEFKQFGKTIGISPWPTLNNTTDIIKLVSPENKTIDSVAYSDTWYPNAIKKQGGWSLERINYKSVCTELFNWTAATDSAGGTPGKQNSVFLPNYDQLAFQADSIQYLSDSTLSVYFNKPADTSTQNNAFNLSPDSANLKTLVFDSKAKQAKLTYSPKFSPNTSYQLSVSQLKDCAGNTIDPNSFQFITPKLPPVRLDTAKILITEILADPSPEIGLPLVEFIEIHNPGKDTIDLDGWTLNNSKTKTSFRKNIILPNEYLILCPAGDTVLFKPFGKVIGLSIWPILTNAADQIALKSFKGRLSDSVAYADSWHTSSTKKQGGWSLERIDYSSVCSGMFNWSSSIDTSGGTPGRQNSLFIPNFDRMAFKADSLKRLTDSTLTVFFNKAADVSTTSNAFSINPASGSLKSASFSTNLKQATLLFTQLFLPNTTYQLTISNLKDCSGNLAVYTPVALQFTTPKLPKNLDTASLYITEIFADPSPEINLPLVEFVELYNPGKDTIDLEGWTFNSSRTRSTIRKTNILPKEYLILCPAADTLQYKHLGKVAGITPWPSLTNASDQVTLKSFKGRLVDSVAYSEGWHNSSSKKLGGWSLERVDFLSVCTRLFNWASSIDVTGGTPGKQNSVKVTNYDKLDFKADSIKQVSDTVIHVFFNKHADILTATNAFNLNAGNVKSVTFDALAVKAILICEKFTPGTMYQVSISQLKDCAGKSISPGTTLTFNTPKQLPAKLDTAKLYITEIFADPSPEIKLPLAEFVEIYNPGKDTIDLDGWTFTSSATKSSIKKTSISPNGYLILCPTSDTTQYKPYGKTIGLSPWPVLNNASGQVFIKSFKGRLVDSISYYDSFHSSAHKKQGGWSIERVDVNSICNGLFNWTSSNDVSGGTPGRENSVYVHNHDLTTFNTDSIKQISDTSIQIFFNKHVDISTARNTFSLEPGSQNIKSITFSAKSKEVRLDFDKKFTENTSYQLKLPQLKDCAGNTISTNTLNFSTPKLPPVRLDTAKLFITEIFADPSPEVKLPLVEFVEIYNPGKDTIDLDGWTLNDQTIKSQIKKTPIHPKQYLILCPATDTLHYNSYGKTLGLSPWPSLNNASDQITLRSFKGRSVDSILYKDSWYKDNLKKSGGWSLERIENQSICTGAQNWMASNNSNGGTPGKQNSVYKLNSNQPLTIIQASLIDSLNILLKFNRAPDSLIASNPDNYAINNGAGKPSMVKINSDSFNEVSLKLSSPIQRGSTYKVTGSNIADCLGKLISSSNNFAEFYYPNKVQKGDIVISEILFNPRIGGADFVEIYNNSTHSFDLKDLSISTIKAPDSIVSRKNLSIQSLILEPERYLVLTTDPENIKTGYHTENPLAFLKMTSMPAFNNDVGTVVLLSGESRIDQFSYDERMHFQLIKDAKGVSLERSAFNRPANEPGNFRSAATSVGYATPGYKNSQSAGIMLQTSEEIALTSKTLSPDNDGFEDALQINYQFKDAGMVANVSIYDDRGMLIRRLAKSTTLAAEGTLIWDGMTDKEQIAEIGVYIVYFDVFNLNGQSKKFRKACVLAAKLN